MAISNQETESRALSTLAAGALLLAGVQLVVGLVLGIGYRPSPADAHRIVEGYRHDQAWAWVVNFHYWGSSLLIVVSFILLCGMTGAGMYKAPNVWRWIGSIGLFLSAFLFQVTGNLLPFDRHDVSTAVVEAGITSGAPVAGKMVGRLMTNGDGFNDATLPVWYTAHAILVPLLMILLVAPALVAQFREKRQTPHRIGMLVPVLMTLVIAFVVAAPHGAAATSADYNNFDAKVSWYTWPLHGSLEAFNRISPSLGWIGSIGIPTLFVLFLLALPKLSSRLGKTPIRVGFGAFLAYFAIVVCFFGGRPAPLTGNQDAKEVIAIDNTKPSMSFDVALAAKGRDLFNSVTCSDCHGKDGKGGSGGPNLSKSNQRRTDVQWYMAFIKDPSKTKPGTTMPGFANLKEDQLRALAEYLAHPH